MTVSTVAWTVDGFTRKSSRGRMSYRLFGRGTFVDGPSRARLAEGVSDRREP
ncbi:hypothetical protein [Streptomyces sp. NPDC093223]|uniref:hypothetical protein n=1 Tax=Streptomyces sp. NPDC093223 TaxID=3366033 RepID=UPI003826A699